MNQNETPLYSALEALAGRETLRMHMPGHKGKPISGRFGDAARVDFTELDGTGNLYLEDGPIFRAEELAAQAAGAPRCCFLTGGSSQGLFAALAACVSPGRPVVLDRNCHRAAYTACAVLHLDPHYINPSFSPALGITGGISPEELRTALTATGAGACLVTSPTYYGVLLDIPALARAAHDCGAVLLVDGAHGAHLPYLGLRSAVSRGADAEVCSAHKTLPALGQTAMLFSSAALAPRLRRFSSVFGTSSPCYALMASMDLARHGLTHGDGERYRRTAQAAARLRRLLREATPFLPLDGENLPPLSAGLDPCRLVVHTAAGGLSGFRASELLQERHGVVCEMADSGNLVFILTCADGETEWARLTESLLALGRDCAPVRERPQDPPPPAERILSPHEAFWGPTERLPLRECAGRAAAQLLAPYPPGVPVVAFGEEITKIHLAYLAKKSYNMDGEVSVCRNTVV